MILLTLLGLALAFVGVCHLEQTYSYIQYCRSKKYMVYTRYVPGTEIIVNNFVVLYVLRNYRIF